MIGSHIIILLSASSERYYAIKTRNWVEALLLTPNLWEIVMTSPKNMIHALSKHVVFYPVD